MNDTIPTISEALARPFHPSEVKFKPQTVKGNRALAIAYIDCRVIQDRLDAVLGVMGWQDEYMIQTDGSVVCKLQLKLGDQWVSKMDVGSPSEQPDSGDRLKAAFSDSLKRAAVKFGIGRYLYRLTAIWTDYDPVKKQFIQPPKLPSWAIPVSAKPAPEEPKPVSSGNLPANGIELQQRLQQYEAKLAAQKLCANGALLAHVAEAGARAGYGEDLTRWNGPAIAFAVQTVKQFDSSIRGTMSEAQQAA